MDKYLNKRLEGRYEIQQLIGTGGMSNVYRAYDTIDQRTVAVKILRDEYLNNEEFLRRFKNESKAIAVLSHSNIVRVFDVSFTNSVHSIVMEYIDGITLKDYIEHQGPLVWKEAVHFTLQILRALQHAHDKGIVHRDIKPQNIMLLQNGEIKVTDFGIARFARSEVRTITDRAIGSVHYISPEQAMGENTDEKSDIYSVGVMLFEMLTGELPFEADSAVSVAIKQIQTQARMPRTINPNIPEGLEEITVRAMQKDAKIRYQSAAEMIADIERFKNDPTIHFEYKYLGEENQKAKNKHYRRAITETREEEIMDQRSKTPYLAILTGVTLAFVFAALGFVGLMVYLNNPFVQVGEEILPNLIGLKFDTALQTYEGFSIVVEQESFNNEYGTGVVYEQRPKAGTTIKVGSTVRVKVSRGQEIIQLPNFTGKPASQTISKLIDLGLEPNESRIYSDEVGAGKVIYTDPSRDSEIASGTNVNVYVSMGPEVVLVTVPSLRGSTLESAKALLEQKKLRLGEVTYVASDQPAETVVSYTPGEGSMQIEGTEINLEISREGYKRYSIPIPLPVGIDREVRIRAYVGEDGATEMVAEEILNPKEAGTWNPDFLGEEGEEIRVRIYIEGRLYHGYYLDFTDGSRRKTQDRSDYDEFKE